MITGASSRPSRGGLLGIALAFAVMSACGDDGGPRDTNVEYLDTTGPRGTDSPDAKWTSRAVPGEGNISGEAFINIAVSPSDELAVAYFLPLVNGGECSGIDVDPPYPDRNQYDLRLATRPSGGDWALETVDSPVYFTGPRGIGLAYDSSGSVMVAYPGGEPDADGDFCISGDALLATKTGGAWQNDVVGAESGDSPSDLAESQNGYIVGFWPGIALDADERPALIYQDVHFLHAGENRNDAEFAWNQGGSWTHEVIDPGTGAGDGGALVFDSSNRPIAFYGNPTDGVWAARRSDGGEWELTKIHSGTIQGQITAAIDPVSQEPVAAMFVSSTNHVKVVRLTDEEHFTDASSWISEEVGQNGYVEGHHVSMAFTPGGNMALSYYRCRRNAQEDDACNHNDDGLMFALKNGGSWSYQTVDEGDQAGECGTYSALAFTSDGIGHIAYLCNVDRDGERAVLLYVASKKVEDVL